MQNIHLNTNATQRRTLWIGLAALACVSAWLWLAPLERSASGPAIQAGFQPRFAQAEPASHATFAPARMRSGGREIAGFSARLPRSAKPEALTPPAGLKPAETEAWLAMAQRQDAATKQMLESFYPARYGEPFIVEGGEGAGVRVAVRPVGGAAVAATLEDGKVIYREAYPATDSQHVATEGRSEEFLYLHSAAAPDEFEYEISEMSAGTQIKLVDGEVRFTNRAGQGVRIEAPWVQTPDGARRTDVVRWELAATAPDQAPRLWLKVTAEGLPYPLVIDPSWATTGSLATTHIGQTATLLPNGKVLVAGGSSGIASTELYDPAAGTWAATDSLATNRFLHTATLLPNGKVLVAGGSSSGVALASAELYDPAAGTWAHARSLAAARYQHTATLLPNGKVLVAGGFNGSGYLASAELYDPAAGTWAATGGLAAVRYTHTATLLPNGKVLVAGGYNGTALASAELYDSATGTWAATGSLNAARWLHTATLLPNGQVLVAGGSNSNGFSIANAELYDPAAGTWTTTGSLAAARRFHTATLLPNGQVLVAGGASGAALASAELYDPVAGTWAATGNLAAARYQHTATLLPNGKVLVAGGSNGPNLASAELYDSAAGAWAAISNLIGGRFYHTATLLPNGKVLVAAGAINSPTALTSAELYDPATGTWAATGSLAVARFNHTATLLPNGKVLVVGGTTDFNGTALASAELYDPAAGTWTTTGSLAAARYQHTATLLPNGKVLVAGGGIGNTARASAELYDPAAGTWTITGSMAAGRYTHTATLLPNGKVLVAGGQGGAGGASAELYDPAAGTWTITGSMAAGRREHTATLLPNGKVLVAGQGSGSTELYNPAAGTWTTTGSLTDDRRAHTATLLPNGKVLVAGGIGGNPIYRASAELYDPATGTWTFTGSLVPFGRYYHTATLLPNGKVLVAGGYAGGSPLANAGLYDVGLGFQTAWQPVLTSATSPLAPGAQLTATGTQFKGISEASGGSFNNSATNYPLVQLQSLVNEQSMFLPLNMTAGWSATSFTSTAITPMTVSSAGFPPGYALVTVFTNGIPSTARFTLVNPILCPTITGTLGGGGTICATQSANVTVTVSGGTAPYTVVLTNGGGTQTGNGPTFTFSVTPGATTSYQVAAGSQDANGCAITNSGTATVTVNQTPAPTITADGPATFCAGGSVALMSSSATGYQWLLNGNPLNGATNQTYSATAAGSYTVVVTSNGCPSAPSAATVVTVTPLPTPANAGPDQSSCVLTATLAGNTPSVGTGTWTQVSGPGTLSFGNANAPISTATATATGAYTLRWTIASGSCSTAQDEVVVTFAPPTLNPATLSNGTIGAPYSATLTTIPAGTYSFAVTAGALPGGLSLSASGVISGTPTATGTFNFTATATGTGASGGCGASRSYTVVIAACPTVTLPATPANGVQGMAYNQSVAAIPAGSYTYAVTTNILPPGLTLNSASGVISGTPAAAGNFTFAVTVTGYSGTCSSTQAYNLLVTGTCGTITLSPASLPGGTLGTAYNQTVSAQGGDAPYTFSVATGALPDGLTLNASSGVISGTPTRGGVFVLTLKATGAGGCFGTRSYVVNVACAALTFDPASLTNARLNAPYSQQLRLRPEGNYSFSLLLGALPPGLNLTSAGLIYGTPALTGSFNFTVKAQAGTCQTTKSYTLTVSNAATTLARQADYDGDGKADPALWSPGTGVWTIARSSDQQSTAQRWGAAGDVTLLGDYDGDGKTDLAVFRPSNGTWYVKRSSDGGFIVKQWGVATDVPVPGDYDGDGKTDIAVWRPSDGGWYVLRSSDGQADMQAWGAGIAPYNDSAVPGDYDGDGKTDVAVFRRSTGAWLVKRSSDGQFSVKVFGTGTDTPVAADYDGDGATDIAVWRGGTWYIWQSATQTARVLEWGAAASPYFDQATPQDFDGDGQADVAVWRSAEEAWLIQCSGDNGVLRQALGRTGDLAVTANR